MWTWSFELADVLTTLTIISTLGGMAYYLIVRPFLQRLEEDRINDRTFFSSKYDTLIETLRELKEEIKLSRQDRIQQAQRHLQSDVLRSWSHESMTFATKSTVISDEGTSY